MRIQEFNYAIDVAQSLLWQFNEAENIQSLVEFKQTWINDNQQQFWTDWYRDVFNLQTANSFGLAVWSIILALPLFIEIIPDSPDKPTWGLSDDDDFQGYYNFENGNFAREPGDPVLTLDERRLVLQLRYFQLITRGAIPEVNDFLRFVFKNFGVVYLLDGLDMTEAYVFMFALSPNLLTVLQTYDLLPRPAAVGIRYIDGTFPEFGLSDDLFYDEQNSGNENFDNGEFYA